MAQELELRLELARSIRGSLATENELTRDQARAFVRGLQKTWDVPAIAWRSAESVSQLDDARRLIHAARIFREGDSSQHEHALECYRRAAEILEWLARADDPLRTVAPIDLFAAAAFQLGGLPAMARGLLEQLKPDDEGSKLYGAFLQADFDRVIRISARFWAENASLTGRSGSREILEGESDDRLEWYFTVELVRALGLFAHAIRRNDTRRLERALVKLRSLDDMALRTFSEDVSILVSLLQEVAREYVNASIFKPLQRLAVDNPAKMARLDSYARGQFARGRGILWLPQLQGLERLLTASSFALCTPTGSGKTLVAIMALLKELVVPENDDGLAPLAIYLVPSRALAGEVEAKLRSELGRDVTITGLYGGTDWGITDYWLQSDNPTVLIATVEKADALMRYVAPLIVSRLKLLIIDEAHQVVAEDSDKTRQDLADHSNRAIRIESFVSRLLARAPHIARIALTAVAGGASGPVARWIEGSESAQAIGTRYRSTRQVIGSIVFQPQAAGRVEIEMVNGQTLFVRGRDEAVYIPLRTPAIPRLPALMRSSVNRFNAVCVLWTVLHLIGEDRQVLISVMQEPEEIMRWFREAFELPTWQDVNPFRPPEDGENAIKFAAAQRACVDYCGADSHEAALLAQGIATSHGQMPQRLRRLMTDLIESRICPITVATATLTEGVNLPFDLIFLTSLKRQTFDPVARRPVITPMSAAEFQNLAGRAGRPGSAKGMEGLTLVALPAEPPATGLVARRTQRRQVATLQQDYTNLLASLRESASGDTQVRSPLAMLLRVIAELAAKQSLISDAQTFYAWLERAAPDQLSPIGDLGLANDEARLADSVDELDAFILNAVEEVRGLDVVDLSRAQVEERLIAVWRGSFARVSGNSETWMERAFIQRGRAVTEQIYPDGAERRRLYQYGFSPRVGRRFAQVAPSIELLLSMAQDYGLQRDQERIANFLAIGQMIAAERGFGFRARDSVGDQRLLANWQDTLRWWMNLSGVTAPVADELRAWQRFVSDNMEFRLGVVIGAVVAQAWSAGAASALDVPSLKEWKVTTGLPWFAFWARELLRWGTLEPFVAFAMSQGLAGTRAEAAPFHAEFKEWLEHRELEVAAEDLIDPQQFLSWHKERRRTTPQPSAVTEIRARVRPDARLQSSIYAVIPVKRREEICWMDAAGFELATTPADQIIPPLTRGSLMNDYELVYGPTSRRWVVRRSYGN